MPSQASTPTPRPKGAETHPGDGRLSVGTASLQCPMPYVFLYHTSGPKVRRLRVRVQVRASGHPTRPRHFSDPFSIPARSRGFLSGTTTSQMRYQPSNTARLGAPPALRSTNLRLVWENYGAFPGEVNHAVASRLFCKVEKGRRRTSGRNATQKIFSITRGRVLRLNDSRTPGVVLAAGNMARPSQSPVLVLDGTGRGSMGQLSPKGK